MTADADPSFFTDRGIPDEIWRSRPYVWWTPESPSGATEPFADLSSPQRAFVTKLVNQSPGWVITRQPPPLSPPLPKVHPELRPINPVKTQGPRIHWHGDEAPPDDLPKWAGMPGNRANWQAHVDRDKTDDDHGGVNVETLHRHQHFAKYVFATSALMDGAYAHDHAEAWKRASADERPAIRLAHLAKHHDGAEVAGLHAHEKRVKDPTAPSMAKRIDVHPLAVQPIIDSEVVYFVIEGCIKADAILAAGGPVFSVPSVSLWDCDELARFAHSYLVGKTVVIVPDADWNANDLVKNQARMAQAALSRLGVARTHIASPPSSHGHSSTKGVDDFIGAGGRLEDLIVIDSEPPAGLHQYVARHSLRSDRARRDEGVLWALSAYSGPTGVFCASLRTLARVLGVSPMGVSRAVRGLEEIGALTVTGDLSSKRGWFSHQLEWKDRPAITIIPELRSVDRRAQLLGELVRRNHYITKEFSYAD
jgi:hypothetical protein